MYSIPSAFALQKGCFSLFDNNCYQVYRYVRPERFTILQFWCHANNMIRGHAPMSQISAIYARYADIGFAFGSQLGNHRDSSDREKYIALRR